MRNYLVNGTITLMMDGNNQIDSKDFSTYLQRHQLFKKMNEQIGGLHRHRFTFHVTTDFDSIKKIGTDRYFKRDNQYVKSRSRKPKTDLIGVF